MPIPTEYSAKDIQVLSGLQAVRKRPAMYAGDLSRSALGADLVAETLCLGADLSEPGGEVQVRLLRGGWIECTDSGPGLSAEQCPGGSTDAEEVFLTLFACRRRQHRAELEQTCQFSIAVANALSDRFEVDNRVDGQHWRLVCERGEALGPLSAVGPTSGHGLRLRFRLDPELLKNRTVRRATLLDRVSKLSQLRPDLAFIVHDERRAPHWQVAVLGGRASASTLSVVL